MLNKSMIIGNVGKPPKINHDGTLCYFSICTNESWQDKKTKEWKERSEWHNINIWGTIAELAYSKIQQGYLVYVEGKIQYQKYEKDGIEKNKTVINSFNFKILDRKEKKKEIEAGDLPFKEEEKEKDVPDDMPF